jgi:MFS family permease
MSPESKSYRMTILALASLILFGSYFAYDSVGAIERSLIEAFKADRAAIGTMYSMYSFAAIFAVLGGGLLIDRIGTRRASLLFSILVTVGAAIVAWAPTVGWMYFGRLVFGVGSEPLVVAQSAILSRWFRGKELALSFGVALTVSRLGTLFTFNTEALVAERWGWRQALWLAVLLCAASVIANFLYNALDKRAEAPLGLKEEAAGDRIEWGKIGGFPPSFWYVTLLCATFYSAIFPFIALATDFFHTKWGLPEASGEGLGFLQGVFYNLTHIFGTAQGTTSIIITASMFCAPFAGRLVDRIGRRATLMILGSLLMIPAHLALGFTSLPPAIPMIVLGAAFVLVPAAMWPSVPLIVEKDRVGTAFGLMTAIQNIGLLVFPYLNGQLRDATHSYSASQLMFAGLGACGLVFAVLLLAADRRAGGVLERATAKEGQTPS